MIRRLAALGLSSAVAALVGSSLAVAFTGRSFAVPIAITATAPVALAWVCARRRLSVQLALAFSTVGFVVVAAATVGDGDGLAVPTIESLHAVVSGVVRGWSLAMTANLPVPASPEVATIVVLVTWVTAVLTVETMLGKARAELAIVPAAIGYVVALLVGGGSGAGAGRAAALAACLLALLAVGTGDRRAGHQVGASRAPASVRPLAMAAVMAALLGAFATVLAPALPIARADHPFDPRDLRTPHKRVRPTSNPIAEVKPTLLTMPAKREFTARVLSGDPATAGSVRWRIAVLDNYDGRAWSSKATFVPAGRELPVLPGETDHRSPVTEEIEIDGLTGAFLPSPGRATNVSAPGVGFDDAAGMLIELEGGAAGSRYQITADLDRPPTDAALLAAPMGSTSDLEEYLQLPRLEGESSKDLDAIRVFARSAANAGPGMQLRELERRLQRSGGFGYELKGTPPGHSVGSLRAVLQSHTGYAEQFASLFAVAARQLGLPTRVVVGFQTFGSPSPGGVYSVMSTDVHVWAETLFKGLGWVAFDPTPVRAERSVPAPEPLPDVPNGAGKSGGSTEVVKGSESVHTTLLGAPRGVVLGLLAAIGALAMAALATVGVITGLKGLRRRRRRQASSGADRVVAAWEEAQDRMRDWGVPVLSSHTDRQIVTKGTEALGDERARRLGSLASMATVAKFAHEGPPPTAGDRAWEEVAAFGADLGSGRSIKARARAQLNPRSLVGHR